eukprot:Anaeramoba_ignava/a348290_37.p1 GENE.a348290_37~~a348290_37.p1  ORF type:complete len:615 (+),score=190.63 a348290_37:234-1847(+)
MDSKNPQSYTSYMFKHLFDHINIDKKNIHIPNGMIGEDVINEYCQEYEKQIEEAGGLDLVLLGIGRSGHIGFNEPGSFFDSRTRLVVLDETTRRDAAGGFFGIEKVPKLAITMGIGTILSSKEIILLATGEHKALIVKQLIEEKASRKIPATFLHSHPNTHIFLDSSSAGELSRIKRPWLIKEIVWNNLMKKRAVVYVSQKLKKAILELDTADYFENFLHRLIHKYEDNADLVSLSVFEDLNQKILYPSKLLKNERIIFFSPHPDDDVICCGGMMYKLNQMNQVTVAYMTNGSVSVPDSHAIKEIRLMKGITEIDPKLIEIEKSLEKPEKNKEKELDSEMLQKLKTKVRETEALSAIEQLNYSIKQARFLDLPFYKTGGIKKKAISNRDYEIVLNLFEEILPTHIFVAGDLTDPHGTHRKCYDIINKAFQIFSQKYSDDPVKKPPIIWLYRGAWEEFPIEEVDAFLPLSKSDLELKVDAILKHQSQKDRAMFPGVDSREFWQRARDRNLETARLLSEIGLPKFFAIEAFQIKKQFDN